MELKTYLAILLRRWYIVVLVPAIVLVGVIIQAADDTPTYTATAQLSVIRAGDQPSTPDFQYDGYYRYLASEYALDDFVEVVRGNVFAADVAQRIKQDTGHDINAGQVQSAISSDRMHRILTINASSKSHDDAVIIAGEAAKTLEAKGAAYFNATPPVSVSVQTIQRPDHATTNATKQRLIYLLQVVVAALAGVLIALLVDYLDDTLRSAETVSTALDLPVVGLIPRGRSAR